MDKQALKRRARISASVLFAVLTVALCVLWVRGYIDSSSSWFGFDWQSKYYSISWNEGHFGVASVMSKDHGQGNDMIYIGGGHRSRSDFQPVLGFRWLVFDNGWSLLVPSCFPVLVSAALSLTLWIPYSIRFSLRTMLIATTLVAIVLGLVCYTVR